MKFDLANIKTTLKTGTKREKIKLILRGAFASVILAIIAVVVVSLINDLRNDDIKIGDTTISRSQISEYQRLAEEYLKENPDESFGDDPIQVAIDDLILNAAFKKEAADRNMPLTVDDILAYMGEQIESDAQKEAYMENFEAKNILRRTRVENEAYKIKFADTLLAKIDLTMVTANFDTPLLSSTPKGKAQKYYDQARQRLIDEILPLMQSGADKQAIAEASDVSTDFERDVGNDSDPNPYYRKIVTHAVYFKGVSGDSVFNDIDDTSYIKGDVGELYDTDEKIAELENVGDNTGVFAAKIGAYTIVRLEGKSGGEYISWENFLDNYKNEYVLSKADHIKTDVGRTVSKSINGAIKSVSSVGLKKAQAHRLGNIPAHSGCGAGHHVEVRIEARNIDTNTRLSGASIRMYQPNNSDAGTCPAVRAVRTTSGGGLVSYSPDFPHCYNGLPTWTVIEDVNPDKFMRASQFRQHKYGFKSGWDNGFPNSWIPETANNTDIILRLNYRPKPVQGECEIKIFRQFRRGLGDYGPEVRENERFRVFFRVKNDGNKNFTGGNNHNFRVLFEIGGSNGWFGDGSYPRMADPDRAEFYGKGGDSPGDGSDPNFRMRLKAGQGIGSGDARRLDFWLWAPNGIHNRRIDASMYHTDSSSNPFATCNTRVHVYELQEGFSASSDASPERPEDGEIELSGTLSRAPGGACNATDTEIWFYRERPGSTRLPLDRWPGLSGALGTDFCPNNPKVRNRSYNVSDFRFRVGDQICAYARVAPGSVWEGPGGDRISRGVDETDPPACSRIVNKPFVSAFGGDVYAGGNITTFTDYAHSQFNTKGGSGSQLVALAGVNISGFASAIQTSAPLGLTFANTDSDGTPLPVDANVQDPALGGAFGDTSSSIGDFINDQKFTDPGDIATVGPDIIPESLVNDGRQRHRTGDARLAGGVLPSTRAAVFVEGDDGNEANVFISDDVTYSSPSNSSFALLVDGDIYIGPNVDRLDGLYYATGNIYTCRYSNGMLPGEGGNQGSHYNTCNRQLDVRGALTADNIYFERTFRSLRDSLRSDNFASSKAAELIVLPPEVFLVDPLFRPEGSSGGGGEGCAGACIYDAIRALPPIL